MSDSSQTIQQSPPRAVCLNCSRWAGYVVLGVLLLAVLAACQPPEPNQPTPIPSVTITRTPSPSPNPLVSPTPPPTIRPMVTATPAIAPTDLPTVAPPTATPGPWCRAVKAGETLVDIASAYGYTTLDVIDEIRRLNNISGNNISAGQNICVPRPTGTPRPAGFEQTQAAIPQILISSGPIATIEYRIKKDDSLLSVLLEFGLPLRLLCELNQPDRINCGGCDLVGPIPGCRPLLREGAVLYVPGPTPTPTVTPTLSGSETPTATPGYLAPIPLAPANGKAVSGSAELLWLSRGVLAPDEQYLVLWSDITAGTTYQQTMREGSYTLPPELQPTDGAPHQINWKVGIVKLINEQYVLISPDSPIFSFTWQSK